MKKDSFLYKLRLEEGWISVIALAVAFMTVVWSIEGADWTQGLWILPRAAFVALTLGFVLAKVRFVPGLLAHSFMLSVGMVFTGLLVFPFVDAGYQDWSQKLGSVVLRVVRWGESGFSSYDPLVFLVSLGLLTWISGYAVAWLVFRRKQVWMAIILMGAILTVNLAYNPPNPFGSFLIFLLSSLLLVVRFNVFLNEERWRRLRIPFRRGLWRGAMAVGGTLVLLIAAVAFALPSSSQVEPLQQVLSNISGPWQQIQNGIPGFGVAPNNGPSREGRLATNYNNLGKSFTIGGPISLSDEPVLRVTGDDVRYLQAAAMDNYDGKGWIATYQDAAAGNSPDKVFNQLSLAGGQSLPTSTDRGRALYGLRITPLVPGFNTVLTAGDLVSVDRSSLLAYHWERVVIRSSLDKINPKPVPDGSGGQRIVIIDENSGQPIPPDLLPLVKMLKDAQEKGGVSGPAPTLNFIWSAASHSYTPASNNGINRNQIARKNGSTFLVSGWNYILPSEEDLKALNLQPGGAADNSGRLKIQLSEERQPDKIVTVPAANVYLNTAGNYSFTVNTRQLNDTDAMRASFEGTEPGQKIKAEVDRLRKEMPTNQVSYSMTSGVPVSFEFDGYEPNYDDLMASTIQQPLNAGDTFSTQALRFRADELSLRRAGQSYPRWVKDRYLELPEVPQRVKDLAASLTTGLNNPYDKAKAIEAYLRKIPYSLNAPFTPEGRDPVDFFLFDSQLGYCVHYSTAMNVMLRSLGIPTREITGFNGGEFDPATGTTIVRANAAHAWTQVYFPGYGWIDFEPTPGRPEITRPLDPSAVPPLPTPTPAPAAQTTPVAEANAAPEENTQPDKPAETGVNAPAAIDNSQSGADRALLWLLGMLAVVGLCLGIYQGNQWWLRSQLRLPDVAPMAVYERMQRAARRSGLHPSSTMTPYEFSSFLGRKLPLVRGEVRAFTDAYVRQRYGPQAVEDELRRELEALVAARARVAQVEAQGGEPTVEELWAAFKSQTILLHSAQEIRDMWESYQLGLIVYRRRHRLRRYTPGFFRATHNRLEGIQRRIRRWFKKKI